MHILKLIRATELTRGKTTNIKKVPNPCYTSCSIVSSNSGPSIITDLLSPLYHGLDRLSRWIMLMHAKRESACIDNIKITPTLPERAPFLFFFLLSPFLLSLLFPRASYSSSSCIDMNGFSFRIQWSRPKRMRFWRHTDARTLFFPGIQSHPLFRTSDQMRPARKEGRKERESSKRWFY